MIYVDTSLLLPVYVPEERSEEANRVLESVSPIVISDLTVAEFHVSLARKVKLGTLSAPQSDAAQAAFESHLREGLLQRVALRSSHHDAAGRLASKSSVMLRTLDALHIAVAAGLGTPVATFDGRLADAARDLGVEVLP
ncbi:MAG TPA: type II toxin-antitoxin system VapC family toxin [Thermoanaerobaculia bacterium]